MHIILDTKSLPDHLQTSLLEYVAKHKTQKQPKCPFKKWMDEAVVCICSGILLSLQK